MLEKAGLRAVEREAGEMNVERVFVFTYDPNFSRILALFRSHKERCH